MMAQSEFEARSQAFLHWFKAWPGATFHPAIQIQDLRDRDAGRGIIATSDIPEDTVLFTIPRDAIISTQSSDLPKKIPSIFEESTTGLEDADNEADEDGDASGAPDSWVSLILVMIYEYLQGDSSRWKPYFDILPESFDTLMFWSDKELQDLQASAITAKIGKDEADNMFRAKVLPVIEQHASIFYPPGSDRLSEDLLMVLAHRMGSTIMAYAFDMENDEEEPDEENEDEWMEDKDGRLLMGMVPMADILNADAQFNAHVNHEDKSLTVTSLKPIKTGEEVLNYYGPLSNGELLRRYGYVTFNHARYDVVELSWASVLSVLKEQLNLSEAAWGNVMNEIEEEEIEDSFVIDRDLEEPDSKGDINPEYELRALPADLEEQVKLFLNAVRKVARDTVPDKRKRDEISQFAILNALQARLKDYSTSEAEDMRLVPNTKRQHMAMTVRIGEKRLLAEAIKLVRANIDQQGGQDIEMSEPPAKKQRSR
ncbi:SET domain-containing protein [Pseudomassariella vexata]|uniref:SET domain-containing protein n=1 Tax=Pseudomassariella vexata TaxID=1141098 RepID=A0A1Y2ELD3_9PEZI|nr:SET domain-containing protein [Pseudomassariella vexata]ORY72104.1 SET domain-containing protein [Pseudomassariella vexata]